MNRLKKFIQSRISQTKSKPAAKQNVKNCHHCDKTLDGPNHLYITSRYEKKVKTNGCLALIKMERAGREQKILNTQIKLYKLRRILQPTPSKPEKNGSCNSQQCYDHMKSCYTHQSENFQAVVSVARMLELNINREAEVFITKELQE